MASPLAVDGTRLRESVAEGGAKSDSVCLTERARALKGEWHVKLSPNQSAALIYGATAGLRSEREGHLR